MRQSPFRRWFSQSNTAGGYSTWIDVIKLAMVGLLATGCDEKFEGPPEILPAQLASTPSGLIPIAEGDTVSLVQPIQGGHVLFIGALGRNLSTRSASLLGELRRSQASDGTPLGQPGAVLYSDERSVTVQAFPAQDSVPSPAPGWQQVQADPSDMANIPTCPNPLDVPMVDNALFLVVRYSDAAGRSASATRRVVPRCLQTDDDARHACTCECQANYGPDSCLALPPTDGGGKG